MTLFCWLRMIQASTGKRMHRTNSHNKLVHEAVTVRRCLLACLPACLPAYLHVYTVSGA